MKAETKAERTIRGTILACGTSLADVPAGAPLYTIGTDGEVSVIPSTRWKIGHQTYIRENKKGPWFVILCGDADTGYGPEFYYYVPAKAYASAQKNAEKAAQAHQEDRR